MGFRKTIFQLLIVITLFGIIYLFGMLNKSGEYLSVAGFTQGTTYRVTYESRKGEDLQTEIENVLRDIDASLSIYNEQSIISAFNRNDPGIKADKAFKDVFNKSSEVFEKTDGAFDITVGPIVNALGFGSSDTADVNEYIIDSLLQFVGMQHVRMTGDSLVKDDSRVVLDVNAIAQGYSVDVVSQFLDSKKIKNYLVYIGGEVGAKGKNAEHLNWSIGIEKPEEGNTIPGASLQAIIRLKNRSLATSGNYRKYYEKNGIKYVHTIDPHTGHPVISNLLSATVVADDCMTADAYATAFMVMGVQKSIAFLNENKFLDAFLIYADENGRFQVFMTDRLEEFLEE